LVGDAGPASALGASRCIPFTMYNHCII